MYLDGPMTTRTVFLPAVHFPYCGIPKTEAAGRQGFNEFGYVGDDPRIRKTLNIQFLGCSWTQPPDQAKDDSYTRHVCGLMAERFGVGVADWNMGLGGNGLDTMVRTLLCSVDIMKPDFVFLLLPAFDRREYFRADGGGMVRYQSDYIWEEKTNGPHWRRLDPVVREILGHLNELTNPHDDAVNLLKNMKLVEASLTLRGIPWGFGVVPRQQMIRTLEQLFELGWIERSFYIGHPYEVVDTVSRDDSHPGTESRRLYARQVFDWAMSRHGDRFAELVRRRTAGTDIAS